MRTRRKRSADRTSGSLRARRSARVNASVRQAEIIYCNAGDDSRYLSVSDGYHYVGFYNWVGARGWTLNGGVLTSLYTNAPLSIYSTGNGYLYANSGYTPVTVQFH